jgi:hypothetical protein
MQFRQNAPASFASISVRAPCSPFHLSAQLETTDKDCDEGVQQVAVEPREVRFEVRLDGGAQQPLSPELGQELG